MGIAPAPPPGVEQRTFRTQRGDRRTTLPRRRELRGGGASVGGEGRAVEDAPGSPSAGTRGHFSPTSARVPCSRFAPRGWTPTAMAGANSALRQPCSRLSRESVETLRWSSAPVSGHRSIEQMPTRPAYLRQGKNRASAYQNASP